jgi:hypothetical protein
VTVSRSAREVMMPKWRLDDVWGVKEIKTEPDYDESFHFLIFLYYRYYRLTDLWFFFPFPFCICCIAIIGFPLCAIPILNFFNNLKTEPDYDESYGGKNINEKDNFVTSANNNSSSRLRIKKKTEPGECSTRSEGKRKSSLKGPDQDKTGSNNKSVTANRISVVSSPSSTLPNAGSPLANSSTILTFDPSISF